MSRDVCVYVEDGSKYFLDKFDGYKGDFVCVCMYVCVYVSMCVWT